MLAWIFFFCIVWHLGQKMVCYVTLLLAFKDIVVLYLYGKLKSESVVVCMLL